ncbi:MAG: hypothetical protein V3V14_10315 [Saprospiraceae bacterium]
MRQIILALSFLFLLSSCKQETTSVDTAQVNNTTNNSYQIALSAITSDPNKTTIQKFMAETRKALSMTTDKAEIEKYLSKGLEVAETNKMGSSAIGFLMALLKEYPKTNTATNIAKLASALQDVGQTIPGDILIESYLSKYPNGEFAETLQKKQKNKIADFDKYIKGLAEKVFVDPDKHGINKIATQQYVDACEAYVMGNPTSEKAPEYLYRASEMARTLKTYPKALSIYDWIESKYPNYAKTPTVVFLKGFMLENEMNNKEMARVVYQDFLKKYSSSPLVDDVKFLLDNIDKSDEEIMKIIESNKK